MSSRTKSPRLQSVMHRNFQQPLLRAFHQALSHAYIDITFSVPTYDPSLSVQQQALFRLAHLVGTPAHWLYRIHSDDNTRRYATTISRCFTLLTSIRFFLALIWNSSMTCLHRPCCG